MCQPIDAASGEFEPAEASVFTCVIGATVKPWASIDGPHALYSGPGADRFAATFTIHIAQPSCLVSHQPTPPTCAFPVTSFHACAAVTTASTRAYGRSNPKG